MGNFRNYANAHTIVFLFHSTHKFLKKPAPRHPHEKIIILIVVIVAIILTWLGVVYIGLENDPSSCTYKKIQCLSNKSLRFDN